MTPEDATVVERDASPEEGSTSERRGRGHKFPAPALWALGLTQIIGYGTLYYSFSILVPAIAREFAWPAQWVFGACRRHLWWAGLLHRQPDDGPIVSARVG